MKTLKKKTNRAFGKTIYLLGQDEQGINYWLEAPSFDCGWYWGFGYVNTYTNNNVPNFSKDIVSHTHIGGYNNETKNKSYNFLNDSDYLVNVVYNDLEKIKLVNLFNQFYSLGEKANKLHKSIVNQYTGNDYNIWKELNETTIPNVMNQIIEILTPNKEMPIKYNHKI